MMRIIPVGTRAISLLIPILALGGCYADPYCAVNGAVEGNFSGQIAWRGTGEGECSLTFDNDGITMGTGTDHIEITAETYLGARVNAVGQYPSMDIVFSASGKEWTASNCVINIVSVVREDWTKHDYLYITGTLDCPALTSPDASSIDLVGVAFTGYFIEEGLL